MPEEIEPGKWVGVSSALMMMRPVDQVMRALSKPNIDIHLLDYAITLTAVYTPPRPYGFDFRCERVEALLATIKSKSMRQLAKSSTDFSTDKSEPVFNEDRSDTVEGKISKGVTKGRGFRQIGTGAVLHFEIEESGRCNVHIDSHGYVTGLGQYDWGYSALRHGYWDLLSDQVPGLFGAFGERGRIGPMVRPIRGLDGEMRWYVGLTGGW